LLTLSRQFTKNCLSHCVNSCICNTRITQWLFWPKCMKLYFGQAYLRTFITFSSHISRDT